MWVNCARIKGNGKAPIPVEPTGKWMEDPRGNGKHLYAKPNDVSLDVCDNPSERIVSGYSSEAVVTNERDETLPTVPESSPASSSHAEDQCAKFPHRPKRDACYKALADAANGGSAHHSEPTAVSYESGETAPTTASNDSEPAPRYNQDYTSDVVTEEVSPVLRTEAVPPMTNPTTPYVAPSVPPATPSAAVAPVKPTPCYGRRRK
jgi:hypothetical protein